ncbi:SubName: Full=Uncharacterized protein {ECO:0000313/EMBL:CCA70265.1} [Serendipita indica DSM 11827]|nr:SubName: Full=Uncharacterized protein {ECO:0000313/EMBL:CCA70265.1} [Serendipita indica DSM 11827]
MKFFAAAYLLAIFLIALPAMSAPVPEVADSSAVLLKRGGHHGHHRKHRHAAPAEPAPAEKRSIVEGSSSELVKRGGHHGHHRKHRHAAPAEPAPAEKRSIVEGSSSELVKRGGHHGHHRKHRQAATADHAAGAKRSILFSREEHVMLNRRNFFRRLWKGIKGLCSTIRIIIATTKSFAAAYIFAILLVALPVLSAPVPIDLEGALFVKRSLIPEQWDGLRHTFNVGVQLPTGNQEEQHHTRRSLSENGYLLEKRGKSKNGNSKPKQGGGGYTFNIGVQLPTGQQEEQHHSKCSFSNEDVYRLEKRGNKKGGKSKQRSGGGGHTLNLGVHAPGQEEQHTCSTYLCGERPALIIDGGLHYRTFSRGF